MSYKEHHTVLVVANEASFVFFVRSTPSRLNERTLEPAVIFEPLALAIILCCEHKVALDLDGVVAGKIDLMLLVRRHIFIHNDQLVLHLRMTEDNLSARRPKAETCLDPTDGLVVPEFAESL